MNPKLTQVQRTSRAWLCVIVLTHRSRLPYCTLNIFCRSGHLPLQVVPGVVQLLQSNLHMCLLKFRSQWGMAFCCSVLLYYLLPDLSSFPPSFQKPRNATTWPESCAWRGETTSPPDLVQHGLGLLNTHRWERYAICRRAALSLGAAAWDHRHRCICSGLQKKYSFFASWSPFWRRKEMWFMVCSGPLLISESDKRCELDSFVFGSKMKLSIVANCQ